MYSIHTRLLFSTTEKSILSYGCETLKISSSITKKLQVSINKALKRILGIFWFDQISNEKLLRSTHQSRIDLEIRRRKWSRLDHTLRKPSSNITSWTHKPVEEGEGLEIAGVKWCWRSVGNWESLGTRLMGWPGIEQIATFRNGLMFLLRNYGDRYVVMILSGYNLLSEEKIVKFHLFINRI